jgi:hypothetical protein
MTEAEKALRRLHRILNHLKALNRRRLTEREQEVLSDVIESASTRAEYILKRRGATRTHRDAAEFVAQGPIFIDEFR